MAKFFKDFSSGANSLLSSSSIFGRLLEIRKFTTYFPFISRHVYLDLSIVCIVSKHFRFS